MGKENCRKKRNPGKKRILFLLGLVMLGVFAFSVEAIKILHIGDSHTAGSYGRELESLLEEDDREVITYGCVEAIAKDYVEGGTKCDRGSVANEQTRDYALPTINEIVELSSPDLIIVSLGTNYLSKSGVVSDSKSISLLLDSLNNKDCYWVGAPKSKANNVFPNDINLGLASVINGRCMFIDATEYSDDGNLDEGEIHYTAEGGKEWARGVFEAMGFNLPSGISRGEGSASGEVISSKEIELMDFDIYLRYEGGWLYRIGKEGNEKEINQMSQSPGEEISSEEGRVQIVFVEGLLGKDYEEGIKFLCSTNYSFMIESGAGQVIVGNEIDCEDILRGAAAESFLTRKAEEAEPPTLPSEAEPYAEEGELLGTGGGYVSTQSRQIDEVWMQIRGLLGLTGDAGSKIWALERGWLDFNAVYPPAISYAGGRVPAGMDVRAVGTAEIDSYIREASREFGVEAALIKAVMKHESSFNQWAGSETGCKGLMQVCKWSGYKSIISQHGLVDNPFEAKSSTYVGTHILREKMEKVSDCKEGDDRTKCALAAYNAGEAPISAAAGAAGGSWAQINQKLQNEEFVKLHGYGDDKLWKGKGGVQQKWTDMVDCGNLGSVSRRKCKFARLNSYVAGIMKDYNNFKPQFVS